MKKSIVVILALALFFGLIACKPAKSYTVQFDTLCDIPVSYQKVQRGEKIRRPSDPYRENYQFEGWYAGKDYNEEDKWSFIGYTVTGDITLYAKWTALPTPGLQYKLINDNEYEVSAGDALFFEYKDIVIPSEYGGLPVTRIANNAFNMGEELTSITMPNTITYIGEYAFFKCTGLTNIIIPISVTTIEEYAFSNCTGLENITIQGTVNSIKNSAFIYCVNLSSILIPESVTNVEGYAFAFCGSLTIYAEALTQPEGWATDWNFDSRPIVFGCTLSPDTTYITDCLKNENRIINPKDFTINQPYRNGYTFNGWAKFPAKSVAVYPTISDAPAIAKLHAVWIKDGYIFDGAQAD